MSMCHMEPLALWGKNKYTTGENIRQTGIHDYVVYHVPRTAFRSAASTFGDVRHADSDACFEEISFQLFLQMLFVAANPDEANMPAGDQYPFVKAYLEWIPYKTEDGLESDPGEIPRAVGYNIHAVSLVEEIQFGKALNSILFANSHLHRESMNRKMNSRKSDPLAGLFPYQKWMRVTGAEMFTRTICDRYDNSQYFTERLESVINPKLPLYDEKNPANPTNVFILERVRKRLEKLHADTCDSAFLDMAKYGHPHGTGNSAKTLSFPSSSHVLLLTPEQLHPKVFCRKYLPEHQLWMELQKTIAPPEKGLDDVDEYDNNVQTEYDIRTAADIEKARLDGLADRSAFENLAMQSKARYVKECMDHEHTDAFIPAYAKFQDWAVVAMERQCLDPDAKISEVVSKMLRWRNKHHMVIKHNITSPELSVFANRFIGLMEVYEQYYLISTAHRMMYLIQHARYDAFRRDFGLHFNCFQAGDGACSKSFLFDLMAKLSIPGTIEVLTYQTGKADAVDGNRNDITTVCHEAPPGMFRTAKNPNADSTQEAMFKEKLTSQRVTAKIWCQDEGTGKRSARLTKSECVGVWMGATNDPPSEVEEALKTRFFWGNFEQQRRVGRDIDDCMNGERMMSTEDKLMRKKFFREAQEEQFRVMLVEKAIWAKVIKDVNTMATNILLPRLKKKLNKNSIIRPNPRDWVRVKIFARNQAIVTAIETVCNLPSGKHYGQPFAAYMIPDLEPYLKVTEEMVIFAVSLLADQFRSPIEHKILHTIGTMEKGAPQFGKPNSDEHCVDYIKLPKLKQLSRTINSRMSIEKGKTSTNNIEAFLLRMRNHAIKSKPFKDPPIGSEASEDKYPIVDKDKSEKRAQSCVITQDGVYIHMKHIKAHLGDSSDSIFHILANETHMNSSEKRMITACPAQNDLFHVMRVIQREPGGKALKYHNVLANTSISRWITQTPAAAALTRTMDGYAIEKDIDEYVREKWSEKTSKPSYTPAETMQYIDDAIDDDICFHSRPEINYPEDLLRAYANQKRARDADAEDEDESAKRAKTID
ncbi:hypothetical protein N9A45_01700 [bacterium]|nr:hypothetical protein [bacterium]